METGKVTSMMLVSLGHHRRAFGNFNFFENCPDWVFVLTWVSILELESNPSQLFWASDLTVVDKIWLVTWAGYNKLDSLTFFNFRRNKRKSGTQPYPFFSYREKGETIILTHLSSRLFVTNSALEINSFLWAKYCAMSVRENLQTKHFLLLCWQTFQQSSLLDLILPGGRSTRFYPRLDRLIWSPFGAWQLQIAPPRPWVAGMWCSSLPACPPLKQTKSEACVKRTSAVSNVIHLCTAKAWQAMGLCQTSNLIQYKIQYKTKR